jgi:hypothetical protein
MLAFYGLVLREGANHPPHADDPGVEAHPGPNHEERWREWLQADDHNHLRLTRILRSCHLLGLRSEAQALGSLLDRLAADHPGAVSRVTRDYWARASKGLP